MNSIPSSVIIHAMTKEDLDSLKKWFSGYCRSFYYSNKEDQKNIILKETHTHSVCANIIAIAGEQSLSGNDIMIAETVALFHDIGRFSQYAKYKTFNDRTSVNHGKLGAEVLEKENALEKLSPDEQELILNVVRFHNAFHLPSLKDEKTILFLKLIRDADKLDILRVFTEYYEGREEDRASATALGLPDTPEYSEEVLSCLYEKRIASYSSLRTLNDFRLLQLSWVYDLNFVTALRLVVERGYIERIFAKLPGTERIAGASMLLKEFTSERLKQK